MHVMLLHADPCLTLHISVGSWVPLQGILIEPGPGQYLKLANNRQNAACVNAAICSRHQTVHFAEGGAVGGVYEFMTPEFVASWHRDAKLENMANITCVPIR